MSSPAAGPTTLPDPIAEGRVAQVYPWGDGKVLKLARDGVPPDWITYEHEIASLVHASGVTCPEPHGLVTLNGRTGILFTRLEGPTMLSRIGIAPHRAAQFGRMLGRAHAEMHRRTGPPGLPDNAGRLKKRIQSVQGAPETIRTAALQALESCPPGDRLLHGDFHPGNVILTPSGPVGIDWVDASRGHPLSDVARTVVLANLGGLPAQPLLRQLVRLLRAVFVRAYLRAYFSTGSWKKSELQAWLLPVLFARLAEDITEERPVAIPWLLKLAKQASR